MIRKIAYLTAVAGLALTTPALAQEATSPAAEPAQAQQNLTLQPGASVRGSDGAVLGRLEGVRSNAAGEQELTVRGSDGALRGVPLGGLRQEGADVVVGWSASEYQAAPAVDTTSPTPATPATTPTTPSTTTPTTPTTATPATPDGMAPDGMAPPTDDADDADDGDDGATTAAPPPTEPQT